MTQAKQGAIPKDVQIGLKNAMATIRSEAERIETENRKLNEPIKLVYIRYIKARKPKDFEFTDAEFRAVSLAVGEHFNLFKVLNAQLTGGLRFLEFGGSDKSQLVRSYKEILVNVEELDDLWKSQYDVLTSQVPMRTKTAAFISLFDAERDVYKRIGKTLARIPGVKKSSSELSGYARRRNAHAMMGGMFAVSVLAGLAVVLLPNVALAGPIGDIKNTINDYLGGEGIGALGYVPGIIWYGFQRVGGLTESFAGAYPGIAGLLQGAQLFLAWRWYRNRQ